MDLFWKATAGILLTVILSITLGKWEKDISILLSIAVCCMVSLIAVSFLEPVLDLLRQLETMGNLGSSTLNILLKVLGIGFVSEIVTMICSDSGNSSMGKTITFLSSCAILWMSIPLFNQLIDLLKQILGEV